MRSRLWVELVYVTCIARATQCIVLPFWTNKDPEQVSLNKDVILKNDGLVELLKVFGHLIALVDGAERKESIGLRLCPPGLHHRLQRVPKGVEGFRLARHFSKVKVFVFVSFVD